MAKIYRDLTELIGSTPLVSLERFCALLKLEKPILAKLESFNPLGSAKDRSALAIIYHGEKRGQLKPGGVIVEAVGGNMGASLAYIAAIRGYRLILTVPDDANEEHIRLLKALGAEIVLTPTGEGMAGAMRYAEDIVSRVRNAFMPRQFTNPANPLIHATTTAEEIWADTDGDLDFFVCGVGSGSTITGVSRGLKKHNPNIVTVAVEPEIPPIRTLKEALTHKIQGVGLNYRSNNYDQSVVDLLLTVKESEAFRYTRQLAKTEGILAGTSSGMSLIAAVTLARKEPGKTIVVLFADSGERYMTTDLFF